MSTPANARRAAEQAAAEPGLRRFHMLDLVYSALLAGEPRRARRLLDEIGTSPSDESLDRRLRALRVWTGRLEWNCYPGGVGAEMPMFGDHIEVSSTGDAETVLIEHLVGYGPTSVLIPRSQVDKRFADGDRPGVEASGGPAASNLQRLIEHTEAAGEMTITVWGGVALWDFVHRAGHVAEARQGLAAFRVLLVGAGFDRGVALTHLVEGDWYATSGGSPETLGFHLSWSELPASAHSVDLESAGHCYERAEAVASASGILAEGSRFAAALQLRWAYLAWCHGDYATQRARLEAAGGFMAAAGDRAGERLAAVHLVLVDLAEGRLADHVATMGTGWSDPAAGPLAETRVWAEQDGSASWCAGLGRLMERVGERWSAEGDVDRAALALTGAAHLIGAVPMIERRPLIRQLAEFDSARNLHARALIRIERVPAESPLPDTVSAWDGLTLQLDQARRQAQLTTLVTAATSQRQRAGTAAAEQAACGLERVRSQMVELADPAALTHLAARSWAEIRESEMAHYEEIRKLYATPNRDRSSIAEHTEAVLAAEVQSWLVLLDVWIPLARAHAAEHLGATSAADQWFDAALDAAQRTGAPRNEAVNVLVASGRDELARAELRDAVSTWMESDMALANRAWECGDVGLAAEAYTRSGVDPLATSDLGDVCSGAQIALRSGERGRASEIARHGIEVFEERLSRVVRDVDRLAVCDDSDVAGLYLVAAQALVRRADARAHASDADERSDAFAFIESARTLVIGHLLQDDDGLPETLRRDRYWAAAEWAVTVDRLVAAIDASPPVDTTPFLESFDVAEHRLRDVEVAIDAAQPGALLRRARPQAPLTLAAVQERLSNDTVLLEYHVLGDDLMVWAVANDGVEVHEQSVPRRELAAFTREYGRRCAGGSGEGPERDELRRWLLDPVADMVGAHRRVIVVPFGLLNGVAFHTLPLGDRALGLSHIVSYTPAASVALRDPIDSTFAFERCTVVGDPAFDPAFRPRLRRLPGAEIEAKVVARLLGTDDVLTGPDATEDDVRGVLSDRDVVHLATHGWLDELAPQGSSLVMAGRDELTVAELIRLQMRAPLAVLSACDTGRGTATLGGDVVGLTRSLLASGVRRAVVSLWPVDDGTACVTMACFYERLVAGDPPAAALAYAQQTIHGLNHGALRTRYTELAGTEPLSGLGRRRGEMEDRDLRTDEAIPPPLGGDADRHWAPFILVGA